MTKQKVKCPLCKKTLLFVEEGVLEIKCSRCKQIISLEYDGKGLPKPQLKDGGN